VEAEHEKRVPRFPRKVQRCVIPDPFFAGWGWQTAYKHKERCKKRKKRICGRKPNGPPIFRHDLAVVASPPPIPAASGGGAAPFKKRLRTSRQKSKICLNAIKN